MDHMKTKDGVIYTKKISKIPKTKDVVKLRVFVIILENTEVLHIVYKICGTQWNPSSRS